MCDRVAVMYLGKIVELADLRRALRPPAPSRTPARCCRAVPVADPRLARGKKRQVLAGDVPVADQPAAGLPLPHALLEGAGGICDVDEPLLEPKEGGNLAACHFPLTDEEIARRVPTAAA